MKSSILSHNKAHICCRLTADTHPEREFGKHIYTGSRLTTNSPQWQGRFLAEQTHSEHTKRLLDHCHSVVHATHHPQLGQSTPGGHSSRAIRTTFLEQLAVAQAIYNSMTKLFYISHFSQHRDILDIFTKSFLTLFYFLLLNGAWIT